MNIQKTAQQWDEISDSDWYKSHRSKDVIDRILENPSSAFHPTT